MDFPMYVYKPRRGMKRGEESKVRFFFLFFQNVLINSKQCLPQGELSVGVLPING